MAQTLIIRSLCDKCLEAGEETPGDMFRVNVSMAENAEFPAPRPFVVELCPEHALDISNAVLALSPLGRPPENAAPERTARAGAMPDKAPVCPACGESYKTVGTLRAHVRKEHGKSLAGIGFYPANFTCPTCKDAFPNRQGMAVHIRAAHPNVKQSA